MDNFLFYSRKCQTCIYVLKSLMEIQLLGSFKLICVDGQLNNLPPQIEYVPTMILAKVPRPLSPSQILEWINQAKILQNQNKMQNNPIPKNRTEGPKGYADIEMTGISDTFAYTEKDNPLPHSFFGIGDEELHAIFTAPKDEKVSKKELELLISSNQNKRQIQQDEFANQMKQQQIELIRKAYQN